MYSKWVYVFTNSITNQQNENLRLLLNQELATWHAHEIPVTSKFELLVNQVLLIEALSEVSGCSIDWLQKTVVDCCQKVGIKIATPLQILVETSEKRYELLEYSELLKLIHNQQIPLERKFIDTTVLHQNSFEGLLKPISDSWLTKKTTLV